MITKLAQFSDDEVILKMRVTDLRDLCEEIYYLIHTSKRTITNPEEFYLCKQLLEVIRSNGKER